MEVLVIGLGSMGKRRIRNLIALGYKNIVGFDLRKDRRKEVEELYNVDTIEDFNSVYSKKFDAWIISTSPDTHHIYMARAINFDTPAFIEASVLDIDFEDLIQKSKDKNILLAPSCTLLFHPAINLISRLINTNQIGTITNVLYHSGQYLPDWHSYETVGEFYVSKKETGGAREIVPFELTWLTQIFGFPRRICGFNKKTIEIEGAEKIDDTYNLLLDYDSFILNLSVDVVSRHATRRLLINGEKGQLIWDWDENFVKLYNAELNGWENIKYDTIPAQEGYNKNITEQMYIDELNCFIQSIHNKKKYLNSLEEDHRVLKILYAVENSNQFNKIIEI